MQLKKILASSQRQSPELYKIKRIAMVCVWPWARGNQIIGNTNGLHFQNIPNASSVNMEDVQSNRAFRDIQLTLSCSDPSSSCHNTH